MNLFKKLKLKYKLISIIVFISVITLVIGFVIDILADIKNIKSNLIEQTILTARLAGDYCAAPLDFNFPEKAKNNLSRLENIKSVLNAQVYNDKGKLFALYSVSNDTIVMPSQIIESYNKFEDDYLYVVESIELDNKSIGSIYLRVDTKLSAKIDDRILVTIILSACMIVLSTGLALVMQTIISKPIIKLTKFTTDISKTEDYSVRLKTDLSDEIGILYNEFNEMLGVIQNRENERNIAENKLKEVNQKLEQRVKERTNKLELANMELTELAYISAHDLKTPLRGISQLASWLLVDYQEKIDEPGIDRINLLLNRVSRMNNLIDGILQFTRIGRNKQTTRSINLNIVVREAIKNIAPPASIVITSTNKLPMLYGDRDNFGLIFKHLIENAVKYMDKENGEIIIDIQEMNSYWTFSISDNGPGIEEKYFDKIFRIFQTLTSKYKMETTGIGLPLVRKIIELYNGRIWIKSKIGEGCTFFFTISKEFCAMSNNKAI